MATKPTHTPSVPAVATVRITAYWGSLACDVLVCGQNDSNRKLDDMVLGFKNSKSNPERMSYVMETRSYDRAKDTYKEWKKTARYNHLGLEIAL